MGAGSAKGVKPEHHQDVDRLSTGSEIWGSDQPAADISKRVVPKINTNDNLAKTLAEISEPSGSRLDPLDAGQHEEKKEEQKKKTRFGFTRKKDDDDRVDEFVVDSTDDKKDNDKKNEDKTNEDKNNKEASKKDTEKRGFRLFHWKKDDKKIEEKDEALDKDIDDLEKTFDSLGIVGKNMWGEEANKHNKDTVDDLDLLQPMRKRNQVRVRAPRGVSGPVGSSSGSNGSTSSKRNFKFSWESEGDQVPMKTEDDEWEYKAMVIEGFDIEKFRKANLRDSVFDNSSLPNAVGMDGDDPMGVKSPLRYDQNEQHILASIERDFIH
ncbi:cylicin-1-like [Procambarus clarkii]|uniref:cylicin-1-like n=1 Tax=Procambarus clarkii TaxID=6728 RepID=UPI0037434333